MLGCNDDLQRPPVDSTFVTLIAGGNTRAKGRPSTHAFKHAGSQFYDCLQHDIKTVTGGTGLCTGVVTNAARPHYSYDIVPVRQ